MNDGPEARHDKDNGRETASIKIIDRRTAADGGTTPEDAGAPGEPRYPTFVEELKARAEEAERRTREISAAYRRLEQERDAFRERLARDLERRVDMARASFLRKAIEVLDDLDRAIIAARAGTAASPLLEGVAIIRDNLFQALASEGVEAVETAGRPFDPAVAEAVATEVVDDPERDNLVLEEVARGYSLRGSLLRPARVRVARVPARSPGPPEDR
jgi:molecular chaperone GrpE